MVNRTIDLLGLDHPGDFNLLKGSKQRLLNNEDRLNTYGYICSLPKPHHYCRDLKHKFSDKAKRHKQQNFRSWKADEK